MGSGEVKIKPAKGFAAVSSAGYMWGRTYWDTEESVWDYLAECEAMPRSQLEAEGWRVLPCTITVEEPE
jgi:hypothetical protein